MKITAQPTHCATAIRAISAHAAIFLATAFIAVSCVKTQVSSEYIVVEPDWSACSGPKLPGSWSVNIGDDYSAFETGKVHTSDAVLAPGNYSIDIKAGDSFQVNGNVISMYQHDRPSFEFFPVPWIEAIDSGIYYGHTDVSISDRSPYIRIPMEQYARRIDVAFMSRSGKPCYYRLSVGCIYPVYTSLDLDTGDYSETAAQRISWDGRNAFMNIMGMPPGGKTIIWKFYIEDPDSGLSYSGTVEDFIDASVFEGFNENMNEPLQLVRTVEIRQGDNGNEIRIR